MYVYSGLFFHFAQTSYKPSLKYLCMLCVQSAKITLMMDCVWQFMLLFRTGWGALWMPKPVLLGSVNHSDRPQSCQILRYMVHRASLLAPAPIPTVSWSTKRILAFASSLIFCSLLGGDWKSGRYKPCPQGVCHLVSEKRAPNWWAWGRILLVLPESRKE